MIPISWNSLAPSACIPGHCSESKGLRDLYTYLSEFNVRGVSNAGAVWLLVTSIANQLTIPHTKVFLARFSFRKHSYSGPARIEYEVFINPLQKKVALVIFDFHHWLINLRGFFYSTLTTLLLTQL